MQSHIVALLICAALICFSAPTQSAKILAIFPFPGPSQYILVEPYLRALAARGHQLTVISNFPQREPVQNFRDIVLNPLPDYDNLIADVCKEVNKWQELTGIAELFVGTTVNALKTEAVQQLIQSNEKFDLLIVEALQQEPLYALAAQFNAHLMGVSSYGTDPHIDELVGNISPISFTPLVTSRLSDHMNFLERLENLWHHTLEYVYYHYFFLPESQALYQKLLPNATLDLRQYRKKFALVLLNQHFSLSFPRPYVPNAIEVGGMHISHVPKQLPADMEAFINASSEGAIYFSLGSNIKSKYLPAEKRAIILETFASLPVNVLWKFEDTELPGKPSNVYISKWFPQPDVLAHPKVRLFFTHGGLLSTIEAIHHAKPVVGMPFFYDQNLNVRRAVDAGFGVGINFRNFTAEDLRGAIMEVLQHKKYTEKARSISRHYHDQPMKPLDKAIYWTEYVLRHDGATHMRSAGQELNFIQLHSLDTMLVLFGGAALASIIVFWLVIRLIYAIFSWKGAKTKVKRQ